MNEQLIVKNPATGEELGYVTIDTTEKVKEKLKAGFLAFQQFSKSSAYERANLLMNWANLILNNREDLAQIITKENGKPLTEARGEVDYSASYLTWFAEEAKRLYGRIIPANKN